MYLYIKQYCLTVCMYFVVFWAIFFLLCNVLFCDALGTYFDGDLRVQILIIVIITLSKWVQASEDPPPPTPKNTSKKSASITTIKIRPINVHEILDNG